MEQSLDQVPCDGRSLLIKNKFWRLVESSQPPLRERGTIAVPPPLSPSDAYEVSVISLRSMNASRRGVHCRLAVRP